MNDDANEPATDDETVPAPGPEGTASTPRKHLSRRTVIVGAVVALLLLAVGGGFAYTAHQDGVKRERAERKRDAERAAYKKAMTPIKAKLADFSDELDRTVNDFEEGGMSTGEASETTDKLVKQAEALKASIAEVVPPDEFANEHDNLRRSFGSLVQATKNYGEYTSSYSDLLSGYASMTSAYDIGKESGLNEKETMVECGEVCVGFGREIGRSTESAKSYFAAFEKNLNEFTGAVGDYNDTTAGRLVSLPGEAEDLEAPDLYIESYEDYAARPGNATS